MRILPAAYATRAAADRTARTLNGNCPTAHHAVIQVGSGYRITVIKD
jgi:hypothetical protein